MKDTISKNLGNIEKTIKGFYIDLDTISKDIADIETTRKDLESRESYTASYIDEVIKKETQNKSGHVATTIDTLRARIDDLKEYTLNILNASDVYDDARLTAALETAKSLDESRSESADIIDILKNQFYGNFPALLILASLAPESLRAPFYEVLITKDNLENITDKLETSITTLESMNLDLDFTGLATRVYDLGKNLKTLSAKYGLKIDASEYKYLAALFESQQENAMRAAFGL